MTAPILLDQILAPGGLRPVFQPIYRITAGGKALHGLECLTRGPRGTNGSARTGTLATSEMSSRALAP